MCCNENKRSKGKQYYSIYSVASTRGKEFDKKHFGNAQINVSEELIPFCKEVCILKSSKVVYKITKLYFFMNNKYYKEYAFAQVDLLVLPCGSRSSACAVLSFSPKRSAQQMKFVLWLNNFSYLFCFPSFSLCGYLASILSVDIPRYVAHRLFILRCLFLSLNL